MYHYGYDMKQSDKKAFEYYQLSADQGLDVAQNNLGIMYQIGYGVEKSYQKAVEYFKLAADNGYSDAQINLDNLKSSKPYIQYELLEQRKIHEILKQQIEFLEIQIKYRLGGSGYKEVKEHFESLT
jgi:TPR repeat protein